MMNEEYEKILKQEYYINDLGNVFQVQKISGVGLFIKTLTGKFSGNTDSISFRVFYERYKPADEAVKLLYA